MSGKEPRPKDDEASNKWELKAERAAGEIYLLVESDQRCISEGMRKILS